MNEAQIHKGIVEWLALALPPNSVVHHSPNEGRHRVQYRVHQRQMGMFAGWPDLELFIPPASWRKLSEWQPVFLEVKTPKGRLSPNQKAAHKLLTGVGCIVEVVRSIEETEEALKRLIKLRI
tara:strand:- start:577 stop:942 length:366 start_codon:yes stop_codon:yes gene_type:complete